MKKKTLIAIFCITFVLILVTANIHPSHAVPPTTVRVISEVSELGNSVTMPDIVGTNFSIAVVVENVSDLYGLDIQINWTTKYLHCIDHTMTVPVDSFPDPIPPSPYAGILHLGMPLADVVDEGDSIPGAEPGAMGYWGYSSMGTPEFNGSGTVVVLTFKVIDQPWSYEGVDHVNATIHFVSIKLSDTHGDPIVPTIEDFNITIYPRLFTYPPLPMLKVNTPPETIPFGETFPVGVQLMDEHEENLDPFWDIAGFDIYLNFNSTLVEALDVTIDPDGWWGGVGAFWPGGVIEAAKEINNTAGTVHIAFLGLPNSTDGTHTAPHGIGRLFNVTFQVTSNLTTTVPIYLKNPVSTYDWIELNYEGGILTLTSPLDTDWHQLVPTSAYCTPYKLEAWLDSDTDLKLSSGDEIRLTNRDNGKWRDCIITEIAGIMGATMNNWTEIDDGLGSYASGWSPLLMFDTPGSYFTTYKILDVDYVHVYFANGTDRDLTTSEYTAYTGTHKVEFHVCLDSLIVENMTLGVDCELPWVEYPSGNAAKEIIGIHAYFPDGTERDLVYDTDYYYDPAWPCEIEMDIADPAELVDGTILEVTYMGVAAGVITYTAIEDVDVSWMRYEGTYEEFLAVTDPMYTLWEERYPSFMKEYNVTGWEDDGDGVLSTGDTLNLTETSTGNLRSYHVDAVATDIKAIKEPVICDKDLSCKFYGMKRIVDIAGYSHHEHSMCPWHNSEASVPIPCMITDDTVTIPEFNVSFMLTIFLLFAAVAIVLSRKLASKGA